MLTSLEVRWFYTGKLPQEILDWFQQEHLAGELKPLESREDLYLYSPKIDYMGIKLRQERLEIKWRKAHLDVQKFGERVEGKVEKWGKWLCEDPTQESFQLANIMDDSSWVSVKKERSQRLYQFSHGELVTNISTSQHIEQGCNVEITQLNIQDQAWWTIGFETFGNENCLTTNLQSVVNWMLKTYPKLELQAQNSYAYPHWLYLVV